MVTELGPEIGTYNGCSIPAFIVVSESRFEYDRPALEDADGGVDFSQLASNERVIYPGLIYRHADIA